MALTQFEMDMVKEMHDKCLKDLRDPTKKAAAQSELDTLLTGTEGSKQALITTYITDTGLPAVTGQITSINAHVSALQAKKTSMEGYGA